MLIRMIYVITMLIIFCNISSAQQITPDMDKLNKLLEKEKGNPKNDHLFPDLKRQPIVIPPYYADSSQPVFENELGKVYNLPLDNMPILKPNQEGQIPALLIEPRANNNIPNPLYRQKAPVVIPNR